MNSVFIVWAYDHGMANVHAKNSMPRSHLRSPFLWATCCPSADSLSLLLREQCRWPPAGYGVSKQSFCPAKAVLGAGHGSRPRVPLLAAAVVHGGVRDPARPRHPGTGTGTEGAPPPAGVPAGAAKLLAPGLLSYIQVTITRGLVAVCRVSWLLFVYSLQETQTDNTCAPAILSRGTTAGSSRISRWLFISRIRYFVTVVRAKGRVCTFEHASTPPCLR